MIPRFAPATLRLFAAILGFLLAAAGVALDNRYLIWAAMAVLGTALVLRIYLRRRGS